MTEILRMLASAIYLLVVPMVVIKMSHKWTFINKISPMMVLYCIGLVVGNLGFWGEQEIFVSTWASNIAVPIAIPLMLMGCNFRKWSTKIAAKAFFTGLASIVIVIFIGYFLFQPMATTVGVDNMEYAKISAVMAGIYTGGIPNIGAISKAVDLSNNMYLLVTSYDLIVTGIYLLFVIFCGKVVFRALLPSGVTNTNSTCVEVLDTNFRKPLFGKELRKQSLLALLIAIIVAAVAYLVSLVMPLGNSIAVLILVLTTLSLAISFVKPIRQISHSFDLGLYFVYVFCFSIANMVNISELNLLDNIFILYYIAFAVFGSMVIQIILAKLFRIDGDTVLVSSIALINSPPFVPLVAAALNNKDVVLTGISIGLLGYAVGNYLGIGIYELFAVLSL